MTSEIVLAAAIGVSFLFGTIMLLAEIDRLRKRLRRCERRLAALELRNK